MENQNESTSMMNKRGRAIFFLPLAFLVATIIAWFILKNIADNTLPHDGQDLEETRAILIQYGAGIVGLLLTMLSALIVFLRTKKGR